MEGKWARQHQRPDQEDGQLSGNYASTVISKNLYSKWRSVANSDIAANGDKAAIGDNEANGNNNTNSGYDANGDNGTSGDNYANGDNGMHQWW